MLLCSHNSCRSQIADAFLRKESKSNSMSIGVASAGIEGGTYVKKAAAMVMNEVGITNLED